MINLIALRDEILNNPSNIAGLAFGDDQGVAALLNAPGAGQIRRRNVRTEELIEQIVFSEWENMPEQRRQYVMLHLQDRSVINMENRNVRGGLEAAFGDASTTVANLRTLYRVNGSRAGQLWGEGTTVQARDVGAAENLVGI